MGKSIERKWNVLEIFILSGKYARVLTKETLINSVFVAPAQAGVQKNQAIIDSRLRGNDINQNLPNNLMELYDNE